MSLQLYPEPIAARSMPVVAQGSLMVVPGGSFLWKKSPDGWHASDILVQHATIAFVKDFDPYKSIHSECRHGLVLLVTSNDVGWIRRELVSEVT